MTHRALLLARPFLSPHLREWRACVAAIGLALCAPVWAQSTHAASGANAYAEVNRLLRSGELDAALARADRYLQAQPRDPQMRFLKGVLQSQKNLSADALATFQALTKDYPELPEPHNNLAVLHAAAGRYDEALLALQAAIKANPQYAVAHENLGDVYARLAEQAWARSLQIDPGAARVPRKLEAVRGLLDQPTPSQ